MHGTSWAINLDTLGAFLGQSMSGRKHVEEPIRVGAITNPYGVK